MNRLIKLQFRNLFHSKLFYVCMGLTLVLNLGLDFIVKGAGTIKVLPQITSFLSSELSIISIIFVALFSCLDFNEGTTKNIIARGYTRTQFLLSKLFKIKKEHLIYTKNFGLNLSQNKQVSLTLIKKI